ncbi:uncharacterized protein MELLADRAFT_85594 [Melampsora larici-populina 98AG31]|uniref:Uncharacterized protein n=1 Tax=Melampsora larici-populina (strain 98AG31 / pathotype 3-4-7) TaxID=747676 RepID=F4SD87_MELLP|nr:uncharacterized protein MELLADRAFT_85594 [Melampsora larici-populina 98AG31]EGF97391.1 hypothetical protein MELLADRAFT_85594 [Melampsora larici-populina 98AG31]
MAFKIHRCYAFRLMMATYLLGKLLTTLSTPIPMEIMMEHSAYELGSASKPISENTALRGGIGSDLSHQASETSFVNKKSFGSDNSFPRSGYHDTFIEQEHAASGEWKPTTKQKKDGIIERLRKFKTARFRRGRALAKELFPKKSPKKISPIDSAPKRFFKTLFKPFNLLYKGIKKIISKALTKIRSKTKPVKGVEESAVIDHAGSFPKSGHLNGEGARSFGSSSTSSFGEDNEHIGFHPQSYREYESGESSRSLGSGSQHGYDADESYRWFSQSPARSSLNVEKGHSEPFGSLRPQSKDDLHFPIDETNVWDAHFKGARYDPAQTASTTSTDRSAAHPNPSGLEGIKNEIDLDKSAKARELETKTRETTPHSQTHTTTDDQIPHVNLDDILHGGSEGSQADKVKAQVNPTSDVIPKADTTPLKTESKAPDVDSKTHVQDGIKVEKNPPNEIPKVELNTQPAQELHSPPVEIAQETKDPALNSNGASISEVKGTVDDKKSTSPVELPNALKIENPPAVKTPEVVKTPGLVPDSPAVNNPSVADPSVTEVLKTQPVVETPPAANIPTVEAVKNPHVLKEEVTNADKARSELSNEISKKPSSNPRRGD